MLILLWIIESTASKDLPVKVLSTKANLIKHSPFNWCRSILQVSQCTRHTLFSWCCYIIFCHIKNWNHGHHTKMKIQNIKIWWNKSWYSLIISYKMRKRNTLRNKLRWGALTICICNISCALEDGNHNYAHDHQKPVNYGDVNLANEPFWGVNYLEPGEASQSHRLLYAWKCSRYHCLAGNHSSKCGNHKHWPEETLWFTQSTNSRYQHNYYA